MKRKVLAGLVVVGALAVSSAAFAGVNIHVDIDDLPKVAANTQTRPQPPEFQQGSRPQMPPSMSGDRRMPPDGKRPPMSGDRRMPPPDGKRPPMSGDRRTPPNFNGQMPKSK